MSPLRLLFVDWVLLSINSGFRDRLEIFLTNLLIWRGKEEDGRQGGVGDKHRDDRHDHRAGG
jgi:hypothetical protein